jgi:hypothetical protein
MNCSPGYLNSFLIISGVIILENELLSGVPESSSFSNIITPLIIRNEHRYPGKQFILQYNSTTNNQE